MNGAGAAASPTNASKMVLPIHKRGSSPFFGAQPHNANGSPTGGASGDDDGFALGAGEGSNSRVKRRKLTGQ